VSPRVKAICGCRDTHCCPYGTRDTLEHAARHAIYQRAREIERLSSVPQSIRAGQYLDQNVRRVSDNVAHIVAVPMNNGELADGLRKKQREMSRFRQMMGHIVEGATAASVAVAPPRRQVQQGG
jgi:hypothetical protein